MSNREQSNEKTVRENLWYFNEETANIYSPVQEEEPTKLDNYKRVIRRTSNHFIPQAHGRKRLKRECSFVVDWQLSNIL